jgi:hypothetical protein
MKEYNCRSPKTIYEGLSVLCLDGGVFRLTKQPSGTLR